MKIPAPAIRALQQLVGKENVLTDDVSLSLYAYDCSLSRTRPDALINLPNEQAIAPILRILHQYAIAFVARAAATNHAGSCAALNGGVILNTAGLNRILQINTQEGYALVEPGVITGDLQDQLAPLGFFYAPDPASERVCTLGGNLAQNASGARCMKYGGTIDHVLEADFVLPDGTEMHLSRQDPGPDWIGLLAGSEGTLGIIKRMKVKILPAAIDAAAATLLGRVRQSAKDIHDKYIDPPSTTEFGILFVPFEGLYAELVNRGMVEVLQRDYMINLAGPSTMAALLNSLQMGFRSIAIQRRSSEVWEVLRAVKTEFETFERVLTATQGRLDQASRELDKLVGVRTRQIRRKLKEVETLDSAAAGAILELDAPPEEDPLPPEQDSLSEEP